MPVEIFPIDLGFDRCYVLKARGVIAVDAGAPDRGAYFARGLKNASIDPKEVRLVVLTHGHWDHIGSAGEIRAMTGASLAIHRREAIWLTGSRMPLSPGVTAWGKALNLLQRPFLSRVSVPPAPVDLPLGDEGISLSGYGIPGRVLHTPGHSQGSVSVLLDTGDAFVGDLAMNRFPICLSPRLPVFADDPAAVLASWRMLLEQGASVVHPAHGKPFPAEGIRRLLS